MRSFLQSLPTIKSQPHLLSFQRSLCQTKLFTLSIFGLFLEFVMMILYITQGEGIRAILSGIFLFFFVCSLVLVKKTENYFRLINFILMVFFTIVLEEIFDAENQNNLITYGLSSQILVNSFSIGQEWYLSLVGIAFNCVYFITRK